MTEPNRGYPVGALVSVGKSDRVFIIKTKVQFEGAWCYKIDSGAEHPKAGKRVQDAFRWYRAGDMTLVGSDV